MASDKNGPSPNTPLTGISGRESVFDKRLREFRNTGQFQIPQNKGQNFIKKQSQEFNTPSMDSKLRAPVTDDDGYTETERLAFVDASSGLLNTRTMLGKLAKEARRASRYKNPFAVLIIELDGFTSSEEGSLTRLGSEVVFSSFAKLIAKNIREVDIIGRFDEPSLMLICPETNLSEAMEEAGRLRHLIAGAHFKNIGHHSSMTVSIGVASCPDNGSAPVLILGAALEAAQQAVASGGNTVCTAAIDTSVTAEEASKSLEPKRPVEKTEDFSPAFDAAVEKPAEDMSPSKNSTEVVFPAADVSTIIT